MIFAESADWENKDMWGGVQGRGLCPLPALIAADRRPAVIPIKVLMEKAGARVPETHGFCSLNLASDFVSTEFWPSERPATGLLADNTTNSVIR